jgi:fructose-1,6-bisphosphatase/inositol monophosphatase family enzyme
MATPGPGHSRQIDLPSLDERIVGWRGGGAWRDGERVHGSTRSDLAGAIVAAGDPAWLVEAGYPGLPARVMGEFRLVRGYTDAFGHAQLLSGAVDGLVDLGLALWDVAPLLAIAPEAGVRVIEVPCEKGKTGVLAGSEALVEGLRGLLDA